jgi:putative PIN family toxin of toxin-antitoxin system
MRESHPKPAIKAVLDTNILVSSLITLNGNCASILKLAVERKILIFYSAEILNEYKRVLHHPRLSFAPRKIKTHINLILRKGVAMETKTSAIEMTDESDRKFYDLHKAADAILITGNMKHFPMEDSIMKPADFMEYISLYNNAAVIDG